MKVNFTPASLKTTHREYDNLKSLFAPLQTQLPEVRSMAMMPCDSRWRDEWHRPWCCEFHYVINGTLALEFRDGHLVSGNTSELLLIPAGVWHRDVYDLDHPPRVFMLFCSWKMEREFWRNIPQDGRQTLRIPANREITSMFSRIQTDLKSGAPLDELVARIYVQAIFLLALRLCREITDAGTKDLLAEAAAVRRRNLMLRAKQYVEQHYREHISLDGVAADLGVSPYHLSHVFSRESGGSLFGYLAELRMQQARLLLQSGRLSVKEITALTGYSNPRYFSHAFRRHFGKSPRCFLGKPFVNKNTKDHRRRYG